MPIQIIFTGEHGVEVAQHIHNFMAAAQNPQKVAIPAAAPAAANDAAGAEPKEEKKSRTKKDEPAKTASDTVQSKFTLQQCIDRAKEIAGDGKNEEIMKKLAGVVAELKVDKVRNLTPEKLDAFMEALDKTFPKEATDSLF